MREESGHTALFLVTLKSLSGYKRYILTKRGGFMKDNTFPVPYSSFVRKKDAEYDGDPNGDYVKAEDVNELQESIERLEGVIGFDELVAPVSTELKNKVDSSDISDFGSSMFINYKGSSISSYETIEERINAFSYIPYVMLRREESVNFDFFIQEIKKSGSIIFGIINCSGTDTGSSIESEIDWFKNKGFDGVFLDSFGFENGLNRTLQNHILDYAHSEKMLVVVTGEIQTTLFNKPHPNNPQQKDLNVNKTDIYLSQNIFISNGVKSDSSVVSNLVLNLNRAQRDKGVSIFVEDTADESKDNSNLYLYGKLLSTLYNLDGYSLAPNSRYTLNENVNRYLHGFELGKWKVNEPIYVEDNTSVSRSFSKGNIVYDKAKNVCYVEGVGISSSIYTWQEKQIPGTAIDLSNAEYTDETTRAIVNGINNHDHKIHYSKIDGISEEGITPDLIKHSVVRAINNSPAAINKNPPDGYDIVAANNFIHGSVIDYIDAGSIKSGVLDIERIKTNIIDAVNAYIGTATIDAAKIGELTAKHISANVIDAINIYAATVSTDRAKIDQAVIGELAASHIKASVIEAINTSTENAKITAAQIGALTAENIQTGLIEAFQLSADNGEFDNLQAAVIKVINASIQKAFIDGAIIGEGTIGKVQIGDESVTDSKIVELTASKLTAGKIDTGQIDIEGTGGHLRITGNKLQVFDGSEAPLERVVVGDVNGDGTVYGFRVRGEDGQTVLYDEKGVYNEGITDGAITNPKVSDDAIENRNIMANTITGDKMVVNTITAREIAAKTITANEMAANTITADSGIIGKAAIGEAEIAYASITDQHVKSLSAQKITSGSMQITSRNLISNSTFKKGFYDWAVDSNVSLAEISEFVTLNGTNSAHIVVTGASLETNYGLYSKAINVSEGEDYSASVYVLTKNLSSYDKGQPTLRIEFFDDSSNILQIKNTSANISSVDTWVRIYLTDTAPAGASRVRIRLYCPQNGDTYFSRPMLQKGKIVTEWSGDGSYMTEDGIYTGDLNAGQITSGIVDAKYIKVGTGTIFDAGFSPGDLRDEMDSKLGYRVEVISSNGLIFRNGAISTELTAKVYKGKEDVTDNLEASRFSWYRVGSDGAADTEWDNLHTGMKSVAITNSDVTGRATFLCKISDI